MVLQLLLVQPVLLLLLLACQGRAGGLEDFSRPSGGQEDFSEPYGGLEDFSGPAGGQEDFSGLAGGHSTGLSYGKNREDLRVRRSLEQDGTSQGAGRQEEERQEEGRREEEGIRKDGVRRVQRKGNGREGEDRVGLFSCRQLCSSLIYDVYMLMGGRLCKC